MRILACLVCTYRVHMRTLVCAKTICTCVPFCSRALQAGIAHAMQRCCTYPECTPCLMHIIATWASSSRRGRTQSAAAVQAHTRWAPYDCIYFMKVFKHTQTRAKAHTHPHSPAHAHAHMHLHATKPKCPVPEIFFPFFCWSALSRLFPNNGVVFSPTTMNASNLSSAFRQWLRVAPTEHAVFVSPAFRLYATEKYNMAVNKIISPPLSCTYPSIFCLDWTALEHIQNGY